MKKWLTIILLWACALGLWSVNASQTPLTYAHQPIQTHCTHKQAPQQAAVFPQDNHNGEATLSDSSLLLHVCQGRPVRDVHSLPKAKQLDLYARCQFTTLHIQNRRGRTLSSPVMTMPQSRYYVYTLRRMRC